MGKTATLANIGSVADSSLGFRNRIINGAMVIDQRNAGASVTPTDGQFTLDRWSYNADQASKGTIQQNAGAVTPPAGLSSYLGFTSISAYTVGASELFALRTTVEGLNFSDMAFGTASASSITLSFWVRSSLTGTFGGAVENSGGSRSYVFSYTISAANTWEQKTVTISGDTSGTWLTTNGIGLTLRFGLGVGSSISTTAGSWSGTRRFSATGAVSVVGTNGATFYITGVQLEKGSTATSFDYRPYGTELALCQRYYYKTLSSGSSFSRFSSGFVQSTTVAQGSVHFPTTMRTRPTALEQSGTAGDYAVIHQATTTTCNAVPAFVSSGNENIAIVSFTVASGLTAGNGCAVSSANNNATAYLAWSTEL